MLLLCGNTVRYKSLAKTKQNWGTRLYNNFKICISGDSKIMPNIVSSDEQILKLFSKNIPLLYVLNLYKC